MKKFWFITWIMLLINSNIYAEKYALIIAIGDYPSSTGWSKISSLNDIPLIKESLTFQGFSEENISIIKDEQATKQGIIDAIKKLKKKLNAGDIVVIHYSGHGQQIFDNNGDEADLKDEALVPYDASVRYSEIYKGENHIRDDELANIIASIRNLLGSNGQMLMLLDSCHSGSATRGGKARGGEATFAPPKWEESENTTEKGSEMMENIKLKDNISPFIMISGASANELNYEYNGYGSLSFSFSKAMRTLGTDFTYRQLFSAISAGMNVISPNQTPTIEGDIDYKLFNGEYVKQQAYFEIENIVRTDLIEINSGKLQGLFKNTTVNILPAGTSHVTEEKIIAKGKIVLAKYNEASIQLDNELQSDNKKKYWVFVDQASYGDISLNVYLRNNIKDKNIIDGIGNFLQNNDIGQITKDTLNADVILSDSNGDLILQYAKGADEFSEIKNSRGADKLTEIQNQLFNYAQGTYLKNLSLKNYDYEFDFKLVPIEYNDETGTSGELLADSLFYNESGTFEVNTSDSHVVLEVSNRSNNAIYFNIIEINSKGEIAPFMPNDNCSLNSNERKIAPGQTMIFKDCVYSFGPPYEKLILKGFASASPINFTTTIKSRGESTEMSGSANPLERFISNSYSQSRGSASKKTTGNIDAFSTEFNYEIVKK